MENIRAGKKIANNHDSEKGGDAKFRSNKEGHKLVRVQFDMNQGAVEQLDKIRKRIHSTSRAHVVRKSLTIYDWILDCVEEGYKIYLEKDGDRKQIIIPDLET